MNRQFMTKLLERIKETPEELIDMANWTNFTHSATELVNEENLCGTVGCLAGHACMVDFELTKRTIKESGYTSIENVAKYLFGIGFDTSYQLFYKDKWPKSYQKLSEKDGIIAILERALAEDSFEFIYEP